MSQRNVCYVPWWTDRGIFCTFMHHLSTQSPSNYCPKPIHHHHNRPQQLPALPSAWESHAGMSLRDTAAQINKRPPLQVRPGADNGRNCVYLHSGAFVSTPGVSFRDDKVCLCVCEHLCVLSHSSSVSSEYTLRSGNQYQLSSSKKRVKRSIPPQHDNSSSQA